MLTVQPHPSEGAAARAPASNPASGPDEASLPNEASAKGPASVPHTDSSMTPRPRQWFTAVRIFEMCSSINAYHRGMQTRSSIALLLILIACGSTDTVAERAPTANEETSNAQTSNAERSQETASPEPLRAECLTFEHVLDPGVEFGQPVEIDDTTPWPIAGVTLDVSAVAETGGIVSTATIQNTTDSPQHVDYLANGPFTIRVEGAPEPTEPPRPSSIPAPQRMTLPPGATARLVIHQCGPTSATVHHVFSPWGGAVQGTIEVSP